GADRDLGVQLLEGLLQLRAALLLRAAREHLPREFAGDLAVHERLFIAPVQPQIYDDAPAARLLGQQRELDAVGDRAAHEARLDVLRRGVERFAEAHALAAFVVGELGLVV